MTPSTDPDERSYRVVAVPRINKLRVISTLNSSTPVASTNIFIYYQ